MFQLFQIHSAKLQAKQQVTLKPEDLVTAVSDLQVSTQYGHFLRVSSVDFTIPDHIQLPPGKTRSSGISPHYADCYVIAIKSKLPDNSVEYSFRIILRVNRQSQLLEIATNMQHSIFRMHMVLMTRLNNKLREVLQNTEYYLADPLEVFMPYVDLTQSIEFKLCNLYDISTTAFSDYITQFDNNALIACHTFENAEILPTVFESLSLQGSPQEIKARLLRIFKGALSDSFNFAKNPDFVQQLQSHFFRKSEHVTLFGADETTTKAKNEWLRKNPHIIQKIERQSLPQLFAPMSTAASGVMRNEIPKQLEKFGFLESAGNSSKKRVLSIGSGDCFYEVILQEKYKEQWDLFALEPFLGDEKDSNWPENRTFYMYFESLPEEYQFDIILIFNFQLFSGHQEFFQKIYRQLKPGGQLLLGCNLVDPDKICSHLTIEQHIENAFTLSDESVRHPGWVISYPSWLFSNTLDYQYMQRFYSVTKTLNESCPITTRQLTAIEKQINLDITQWREQFNNGAVRKNKRTFAELDRILEENPSLSSENKAPTSGTPCFFRPSVVTNTMTAVTAGVTVLWLLWMISQSVEENNEATTPSSRLTS